MRALGITVQSVQGLRRLGLKWTNGTTAQLLHNLKEIYQKGPEQHPPPPATVDLPLSEPELCPAMPCKRTMRQSSSAILR